MILSIIICFLISFVLRRGSLRIPYRQSNNFQRLIEQNPRMMARGPQPRRNLKVINTWVVKYNKDEIEQCSVCLEEFHQKQKLVNLPNCHHYFHKNCIKDWMAVNPICPVCKSSYVNFFEVAA